MFILFQSDEEVENGEEGMETGVENSVIVERTDGVNQVVGGCTIINDVFKHKRKPVRRCTL